jgi:protoporphyrinogen IX oxidase
MNWLITAYPWIKAFHLVSVIAWMAGLLYLPRLFVYHAAEKIGSPTSETFKIMERRLMRAIMNPAMIAVFVFGALLLLTPGAVDWASGWIYAKLVLVAVLTILHHAMGSWRKDFAEDRNTRPVRFYRMVNEVPTVLMIGIVILVIVKPF